MASCVPGFPKNIFICGCPSVLIMLEMTVVMSFRVHDTSFCTTSMPYTGAIRIAEIKLVSDVSTMMYRACTRESTLVPMKLLCMEVLCSK